jgi:hypothetical protein
MRVKIVTFIVVLLFLGILLSGCVNTSEPKPPDSPENNAIEIAVESAESPIREYFTTLKILWTFDDYSIQYHHNPPHKGFGGLTEQIIFYGGYVQIMVIFTTETSTRPFGNVLRNYSVVDDFGYSQGDIAASLAFFSWPHVEVGSHGWNHTGNLNYVNLSYASKMINYTMWNWKNNYNITPHFFLGPSTSGNYNLTLALKRFSQRYWTVYGENFRWYDKRYFTNASRNSPAVEYIEKPSYAAELDPLFGETWGNPSKNVTEAKILFNQTSAGKELLLIRGHPRTLNETTQNDTENLSNWQEWIDWVYQTHKLININHTEAIYYNIDRHQFKVVKNSEENFTIDLSNCSFPHSVLFSKPLNSTRDWALYGKDNGWIGDVQDETSFDLSPGDIYYFVVK